MDFYSLTRKYLQTLCKKNKIPANVTNVAMADALAALENVVGLEELTNQSQPPEETSGAAAAESPLAPRTAARTSARRKPMTEGPEETAQPLTRTRRPTRRTITIDKDLDHENKNNVAYTPKPAVQTQTGRRRTTQVASASASASVLCTRRSMRLLEKTMDELSLKDKQRTEPEPVKMDSLDQNDDKEKDVLSDEDDAAAGCLEKITDSVISIEEEPSFRSDDKLGVEEDEDIQQADPQAQAQSQSCDYDDLENNLSVVDAKAKEDVTSGADEMGLAEPAVIPVPDTDEFEFPSETENVSDEISSQEGMDDLLPVPGDQNASFQELKSEKDSEFLPEVAAGRNHFVTESPDDAVADNQLVPECVEKEEIASEEVVDVDVGLIEEAQVPKEGTPEESVKQQICSPCEANILQWEFGKQMKDCDDDSASGGNGNPISPPPLEAEDADADADDVLSFQFPRKPDNKEKIIDDDEDMKPKSLNDKSLRQLTKMLKEQLQISNKNKINKKNNNNEEMTRPALQTLPQNLMNNNPNKHMI